MPKIIPYQTAKHSLSLQEKIGQLFMPAAFINDSEEEILKLEKLIKESAIGGLCFFHSRASAATNYEGKKEVIYNAKSLDVLEGLIERYQNSAKYPLIIAIDAEWGLAMRVENTPQYPYAITLGAIPEGDDLIFEVGKQMAIDCLNAGIHWNFAPVADINNNPENPVIGYRSFGENKEPVSRKAIQMMKGMQSVGLLTSSKHFPGHGDTATDSHLGLPLIDKSKEALLHNELYPFQKLIENKVDSVMVGHLSVPALTGNTETPTSVSSKIIREVLRKELGFDGLVVTDALNMHAVSRRFEKKGQLECQAFLAGNDILCFAENVPEGIEEIAKEADPQLVEESFERIWKLKEKAMATATQIPATSGTDHAVLNQKLAEHSLSFVRGNPDKLKDFSGGKFIGLCLSAQKDSLFFDTIAKELPFEHCYSSQDQFSNFEKVIGDYDQILIGLVPPKVKPQNNFDIPAEQLEFIRTLSRTKKVVLYLFGNPYVLNLFDLQSLEAVIVAYQDFPEFQKNAAYHFLGRSNAVGMLPVTVKNYDHENI
ncbi:glycoside hydrolase family 3 protein [Flavobacteriaceae bacterium R33]|uniref:beta-N-acetylhexosaminidase n=2 Tax=Poritiphilus flavus TaxID=2697053 RepID=A0A6L9E9G8_9FLAO|nr:glycoside hydrolase family 3 protein [Poritiphilus flavus]